MTKPKETEAVVVDPIAEAWDNADGSELADDDPAEYVDPTADVWDRAQADADEAAAANADADAAEDDD